MEDVTHNLCLFAADVSSHRVVFPDDVVRPIIFIGRPLHVLCMSIRDIESISFLWQPTSIQPCVLFHVILELRLQFGIFRVFEIETTPWDVGCQIVE